MGLTSVLGLGGGSSNTSIASKVDQAIESFGFSATGASSFTAPRVEGGTYAVYVWTSPGSFQVTAGSRDIDMFVLGGGGAGSPSAPGTGGNIVDNGTINGSLAEVWRVGGGGGGGGYDQKVKYPASATPPTTVETWNVTVGPGGSWPFDSGPKPQGGRSGNSTGGGQPSTLIITRVVDGNAEPNITVLNAQGGDGGDPSPQDNPPNNRGYSGSGVGILDDGTLVPVPPGSGDRGNIKTQNQWPNQFASPLDYFVSPSAPSPPYNETIHGYSIGGSGGGTARISPTGVFYYNTPNIEIGGIGKGSLLTPGDPNQFPRNSGPSERFQYEGESNGGDGFEVDATIFGGWTGLPSTYGIYWGAGGGGGLNSRPSKNGGTSNTGSYGRGGFQGGGNGGWSKPIPASEPSSSEFFLETVGGSNATGYGSGGGGAGMFRAYAGPSADYFSVGARGGNGFKGIAVVRFIKTLY